MSHFSKISCVLVALSAAAAAQPSELVTFAGAMTGTWTCTGQGLSRDHKLAAMKATTTWTAELGGWWLHESFTGAVGDEPEHRYEGYATFDPSAKKWRRVMVTGGGGWNTGDGTPTCSATGCAIDWILTTHSAMGAFTLEDHVDQRASTFKESGKLSMDAGKTWIDAYQLSCTKR